MKWLTAAVIVASTMSTWAQEKLVESVEVRVINVDVVVTDRAGKPVRGLTKDDFEIYENGRKQIITNLYEVANPAAGSAAPTPQATGSATTATISEARSLPIDPRPRRILIFIDNHSLEPGRRADVLRSLDRFLEQQKQAGDEVGIVVWNHSAKVVTPFTKDVQQLKQGIASLRAAVRSGLSFPQEAARVREECQRYYDQAESGQGMSFPEAFQLSRAAVNAYAEEALMSNRFLLEGLRTTIARFAGLDGKKVLVFAGAHLPQAPGEEVYFWLIRTYQRQLRNLTAGEIETPRTSARFALDDVARQATMNDVALYFIDGGEVGDDSRSVENSGHVETSGLETFLAATNTADAFQHLATLTGGVVVNRWSNFDIAFDTVARDLNSYYSLGFKPQGSADDKSEKRISVKVKNRAYNARARLSYAPKNLEVEINERILANLFHGGVKSEWAINVKTGTPEKDGKYFKVPMEISLAPTVTLVPAGTDVAGGYSVYVVMGNPEGGISKVMKTFQEIRVPAGSEAELRKQPLVFVGMLRVRPGENTLSIGVVDKISSAAGFARTTLTAQ